MSTLVLNSSYIIQEIEPILIHYYRKDTGKAPTLYEFKQYVISQATEKIIDVLHGSDSSILKSMSSKEVLAAFNLYIRKLRVR